jgi:hypothetical protein
MRACDERGEVGVEELEEGVVIAAEPRGNTERK